VAYLRYLAFYRGRRRRRPRPVSSVHSPKTCKRGELGVGVENEVHAANVYDAESVYGRRAAMRR
jgi:hypothetical protein